VLFSNIGCRLRLEPRSRKKIQMIIGHVIVVLLPAAARSVRRWLFHLGGLGLIPLGLLDNSPIQIPGILDVATIVLSSRQEQLWLYYALMATAGSVIGGFVTYRLARKGGKEALDRRFSRRRVDKVCEIFGRWGFGAIVIPALLPPPVPMVPFLLAAGAMQYPIRKFLAALTLGRTARYLILAYLAARYGRQIIDFIAEHGHPVAVGIVVALLAAAAAVFYFWRGSKSKKWAWKLGGRLF
jgi:membrane protein YqaA with SNARE-associated domain